MIEGWDVARPWILAVLLLLPFYWLLRRRHQRWVPPHGPPLLGLASELEEPSGDHFGKRLGAAQHECRELSRDVGVVERGVLKLEAKQRADDVLGPRVRTLAP